MKFSTEVKRLLAALKILINVVPRNHSMPVLGNVLVSTGTAGTVSLLASDMDLELFTLAAVTIEREGQALLPARKLHDILRGLPESASITINVEESKAVVRSGKSRFTLQTLPPADFPVVGELQAEVGAELDQAVLAGLLNKTAFCMAQKDVRYYLNGMLFEFSQGMLRCVSTDGHRMALCDAAIDCAPQQTIQVIVPSKGVTELQRLLGGEGKVTVSVCGTHLRAQTDELRLTARLIDGRFPEYDRVLPKETPLQMLAPRQELRDALHRSAVLSNEKYKSVRLSMTDDSLTLQAENPDGENSEEQLDVRYRGASLEVGFNAGYLVETLATMEGDEISLGLTDANQGCLLTSASMSRAKYVVMPMRV